MFNSKRLDRYVATALERHRIYKKKMNHDQRPWTEDPILDKFRFCNIFRQYDKCSLWMINNIVRKSRNLEQLWPAVIAYRYISSYNMYKELANRCVDLFDMKQVHSTMIDIVHEGMKFNGCFLRNPKIKGGWSPIVHVPFLLIREIRVDGRLPSVVSRQSFENLTKYLIQFSATSGFMAHQYACDLEYSVFFDPTDKQTYATMGPGSKQGMNLLLDRNRKAPMKQDEWLKYARELRTFLAEAFKWEFPEEEISMQDVQNWLCEFQKYSKYLTMEKTGVRVKVRKYP